MPVTPTPRTFTSGEIEVASYLNNLRDVLDFVQSPPLCVLTFSPAISIATSTSTAVSWNQETTDNTGMHSTVTNPTRITPTYAGWYETTVHGGWAGNATGYRQVLVKQNGTTVYGEQDTPSVGVNGMVGSLRCVPVYCNGSTDYLEVYVWQNSGGNLNLGTNSFASVELASN